MSTVVNNVKPVDLKKAWAKFDRADKLTDKELAALIQSAEQGVHFLSERGENGGVLYKARIDMNRLKDYDAARQRK